MKGETEDWLSQYPRDIANEMVDEILDNPQRSLLNEISGGYGRFGLDRTNPVPIFGVPNNKIYMNRLRLENGKSVIWYRVGSIYVMGIENPVDIYDVFNLTGDMVATLYLSSYHLRTSNKAPEGFMLIR